MVEHSVDGIMPSKSGNRISRNELIRLKRTEKLFKRSLFGLGILLIAISLLFVGIFIDHHYFTASDPIPSTIRRSLNFKLYYPNPKKLPVGYEIDTKTISSAQNVLVMTIDHGSNSNVIMSEQPLPANNDLQTFYTQRIPLRNGFTTNVGQAQISALNNRTFVSIAAGKTWIIVTAALNINQNQLKQILSSITED